MESTYTAILADGSRVERIRGRTVIRLEGKEFPTPVTFGEDRELSLLGAMVLEGAILAVDPHSKRLIPVDTLEMTSTASQLALCTPVGGLIHQRRYFRPNGHQRGRRRSFSADATAAGEAVSSDSPFGSGRALLRVAIVSLLCLSWWTISWNRHSESLSRWRW